MKKTILALGAVSGLTLLMASTAFAHTYEITVTNKMADELIAPVLVADTKYDGKIFAGEYVTPAAEVQVLTGDPAELAAAIGSGAKVAHGTDGPPGVLLAPRGAITFQIETNAEELRIFAMVAPTKVPDNYLTAVFDLSTAQYESMMDDDMMSDDTMSDDKMDDDMSSDSMSGDSMSDDDMMDDTMMAAETMTMGDGSTEIELARYDIGNDEGTNTITSVSGMGFASVTIKRIK